MTPERQAELELVAALLQFIAETEKSLPPRKRKPRR